MIKVIFFDVDNVLYRSGWRPAIVASERRHKYPRGRLYASAHDRPYWKAFTLGRITERQYWQSVARDFFSVTGQHINQAELQSDFRRHTRMIPGMKVLLQRLAKHYRVGIISNYPREWHVWAIKHFKLAPFVSCTAVSGVLHIRKPDQRIFRKALRLARVRPAESLYIDDRPERAIGAHQIGIPTVVFRTSAQLKKKLHRLHII
ncbi:MAG: HAD-IA family hydrolase [Candidatus Kerfeldbacteria bacterium]|nr:HAD-IA family hydrolase [Candidatus Kerfeldbacteria bacterium]